MSKELSGSNSNNSIIYHYDVETGYDKASISVFKEESDGILKVTSTEIIDFSKGIKNEDLLSIVLHRLERIKPSERTVQQFEMIDCLHRAKMWANYKNK